LAIEIFFSKTLKGGVAIGAVADQILQPFSAMVIGTIAGVISTFGFQYLTPFLNEHFYLHDTCILNNFYILFK
jgi:ammonium transporter Rh